MSKPIGAKEAQLRDLRAQKRVPRHVEMMLGDGAPLACVRLPGEAPVPRTKTKPSNGGVTLAPPIAIQKAIAADLAADQTDAATAAPPMAEEAKQETTMSKKSSKKTVKGNARKPVTAKKTKAPKVDKGESKTQIVARLLQRPEGCTTADALAATGWPAISMPAQAKASGLTLKKEKDGKVTRYRAA
jgi:hypothetical protein